MGLGYGDGHFRLIDVTIVDGQSGCIANTIDIKSIWRRLPALLDFLIVELSSIKDTGSATYTLYWASRWRRCG